MGIDVGAHSNELSTVLCSRQVSQAAGESEAAEDPAATRERAPDNSEGRNGDDQGRSLIFLGRKTCSCVD